MNYEEQYSYVVYKFNVADSGYYILSTSELPPTGGFSSLYNFTQETGEAISETGVAGYKGVVWSPWLKIDFDDREAAMEARERLIAEGIGFEMYKTGNRGMHFYINRPCLPSHLLPQMDKMWVESNFPKADLSIYTHLHMFRVSGTKHEKTGKLKIIVEIFEGRPLIIDPVNKMQSFIRRKYTSQFANSSIFTNDYIMGMSVPHENGGRHNSLMNLAVAMRHEGEQPEFIARWLYHVNLLFSEPSPQSELDNIVEFISTI